MHSALLAILIAGVAVSASISPTGSPTSGQYPPCSCFNLGHVENGVPQNDSVAMGVAPIPSFNPPSEASDETILVAWASNASASCQGLNWSFTAALHPLLSNSSIKGLGENFSVLPKTDPEVEAQSLSIKWKCPILNVTSKFKSYFTVSISDANGTMYAKPTFSVIKSCFFTPVNPVIPIFNPGMGATSVFFLVVFILTMIGCVVGCGINYIQQGKTGIEIIPGAVTCFSCVGKLVREPRYTPQMDYDTAIGDSDRFGASYQTNL